MCIGVKYINSGQYRVFFSPKPKHERMSYDDIDFIKI